MLLITASVPVVAGAQDGGSEQDPRAVAIGSGPGTPGPTALAAPAYRTATSLTAAAQSGPDAPTCGKASGSVSGEAIPSYVDFVCTASSNQSSAFRIEMQGAWVYVVKIQAPPDASATQIVNGTTQTFFRHGLPETEIGVWPPVLQLFGKEPGEVTIIMNGGSALDNSAGSWSEVGVWQTVAGKPAVELNPGVYEVRVVAIEPFVTQAETLEGLSPEEMTQLAVSGGDRKTGTAVLESGGCEAGYDAANHYRDLEQQEQAAREDVREAEAAFERAQNEYGMKWATIGASVGLAITTSGAGATASVSYAGVDAFSLQGDMKSLLTAPFDIQEGRELAQKIERAINRVQTYVELQIQVLEDVQRCHGEGYTLPAGFQP